MKYDQRRAEWANDDALAGRATHNPARLVDAMLACTPPQGEAERQTVIEMSQAPEQIPMPDRLTVDWAMRKLAEAGDDYVVLLRHGTLEVGAYRPVGIDEQEPHRQDEVYVVLAGSGYFVNGDTRRPFEAGELLFVPAGVTHRFEDFSDDLLLWVVFYGPDGGEGAAATGQP